MPREREEKAALITLASDVRAPALKEIIYDFLQRYDLTKVHSFKDLAKGYQGLLAMQMAFGHIDDQYCRSLDAMRKTLDSYGKALKEYSKNEWPTEAKSLFLGILETYLTDKLSADEMATIKDALELGDNR